MCQIVTIKQEHTSVFTSTAVFKTIDGYIPIYKLPVNQLYRITDVDGNYCSIIPLGGEYIEAKRGRTVYKYDCIPLNKCLSTKE